jgi:hypothetical protein
MTDATVTELRPGLAAAFAVPPDSRVRLAPGRRLDIEQAREFLMSLDDRTNNASPARLAYLIGRLEGHALTLLDVLDAITEASQRGIPHPERTDNR